MEEQTLVKSFEYTTTSLRHATTTKTRVLTSTTCRIVRHVFCNTAKIEASLLRRRGFWPGWQYRLLIGRAFAAFLSLVLQPDDKTGGDWLLRDTNALPPIQSAVDGSRRNINDDLCALCTLGTQSYSSRTLFDPKELYTHRDTVKQLPPTHEQAN